MSKYLAVIKDSFREAFASRVLWMVLIAITLVLALLAPIGFREVQTTKLTENDFGDPWEFMDRLRKEGPQDPQQPIGHLWQRMEESSRERLTKAKIPNIDREQGNPFEIFGILNDFVRQMNKAIESPDFYQPKVWEDVPILASEAKTLLEKQQAGKLLPNETTRFNRLMLEAAFAGIVRESPPTSVQWRYAWKDFGTPDRLTGSTIRNVIEDNATWVLTWVGRRFGIVIAILVTAPIIPQMFDQGSLHLLLSKPVSRWMLLLAKFVGGCAFTLLSMSYLIVGLWLILGIRFSVWEPRLLLSIPIYLFVFAIYYSVSSLAAVIWRSPIVSVAISVLFWLMCLGLGWAEWGLAHAFIQKDRFVQAIKVKDTVIATNEMGWNYQWDESARSWQPVFTTNEQRSLGSFILRVSPSVPTELRSVGPVFDAAAERLVASVPEFPPRAHRLTIGEARSKWEPVSKSNSPFGTSKILVEPTGKLLIVSSFGLYRLSGDPLAEKKPWKILGYNVPLPGGGPLQEVNPDPAILLTSPSDAALNSQSGELALFTRGTITILEPNKARYKKKIDRRLDGEERQAAVVAFGGQHLVVGRYDGRIEVLDAATLSTVEEHKFPQHELTRFIKASPNGRWFAILRHDGRMLLYDANRKEMTTPAVTGQGSISGCDFTAEGTLLVVDRGDRVSEYVVEPFSFKKRYGASIGTAWAFYHYALSPLYTVFPKPSELDETFDYLLSKKESKPRNAAADLTVSRDSDDPWTPVWSSALFTFFVLFAACLYIQFQEF